MDKGCVTPLNHLLAREADTVKEDPVFYAQVPVFNHILQRQLKEQSGDKWFDQFSDESTYQQHLCMEIRYWFLKGL